MSDATVSTDLFDLYLGADAGSERLRGADLRGYAMLHLAAHGRVDRTFPQRTALALSPVGDDDGWLTIADVLDLDLDLDGLLVVLSACDTANRRVRGGDGVQSLARAFLFAGARAVVASLWPVDDRAASQTMTELYRGALAEGLAPPAALRRAKLAIKSGTTRGIGAHTTRDETRSTAGHPALWGPFVYVGAPH